MNKAEAVKADQRLKAIGDGLETSYGSFVIGLMLFLGQKGYEFIGFNDADAYIVTRFPTNPFSRGALKEMCRLHHSLMAIYGSEELVAAHAKTFMDHAMNKLSYLHELSRYRIKGHERRVIEMIHDAKNIKTFKILLSESGIPPLYAARTAARRDRRRPTQTMCGYERIILSEVTAHKWGARAEAVAPQIGAGRSWESMTPEERGECIELYIEQLEKS